MGVRGSTLPCNRRGVNGGDACVVPVEGRGAIWRVVRRRKPVMTARPYVNVEQRLVRREREGRKRQRKNACVWAQTIIHALLSFALRASVADMKSSQSKPSTRSSRACPPRTVNACPLPSSASVPCSRVRCRRYLARYPGRAGLDWRRAGDALSRRLPRLRPGGAGQALRPRLRIPRPRRFRPTRPMLVMTLFIGRQFPECIERMRGRRAARHLVATAACRDRVAIGRIRRGRDSAFAAVDAWPPANYAFHQCTNALLRE